ncbi:olfactory receptor 14J1-like [Lonchura striata]
MSKTTTSRQLWQQQSQMVAIKKIRLKGLKRKQVTVHEISIMKRHRSPCVVNYLDSYLLCEELWLVMEYMDGGTLSNVISKTCLCEEFSLLTIMCYDRYVSICKPLHYGTLLGSRACTHMAAAAWASAFLNALMHTANTFSLPLCHGNALGQFFCEIPEILKLSCSKSYLRELGLIAVGACLGFGCFVFIVFSYVQIFRAVLRIPSEQGWHKAFSTCLPHLAVVSLLVSTATFAYLKPPSIFSPSLDLSVSVLHSVVPPALNPLIYNLRNQELKAAMRRLMTGWRHPPRSPSYRGQSLLLRAELNRDFKIS